MTILIILLVFMVFGTIILTIIFLQNQHRDKIALARCNEDFSIHSKVIFSHQKRSEQPTVVIHGRSIKLFRFFEIIAERNIWKRWVKSSYEKILHEDFPIFINGILKK